jgi:hypothetical protein
MIVTDMFGVMYVWHIELNAISAVNIIMVGLKNQICFEKQNSFILFLVGWDCRGILCSYCSLFCG